MVIDKPSVSFQNEMDKLTQNDAHQEIQNELNSMGDLEQVQTASDTQAWTEYVKEREENQEMIAPEQKKIPTVEQDIQKLEKILESKQIDSYATLSEIMDIPLITENTPDRPLNPLSRVVKEITDIAERHDDWIELKMTVPQMIEKLKASAPNKDLSKQPNSH